MIDRLKALNLQGIHYQKESKRFYPKRELAAQVLGYVGTDDAGLSGIERQYNDSLQGEPGQMVISVDARKKWFGRIEKEPEPGGNIRLTIDEKIQYIAERELEQAMKDTQAIAGTVIVMNPHTGEILALANRPTFNPNVRKEIRNEALKNRAVSDIYEPGSTFKLVTISAALEEKLTNPNEVFDCQMGSIVFNGMRIRDSRPHGLLSVTDVLAESSDVGAIKIALRLGEQRFYNYIRAYGFGQQTGVELPAETRGYDQAGEPLVEGFDCRNLDGAGDRHLGAATRRAGIDVCERWRVCRPAHRRGEHRAEYSTAAGSLSSAERTPGSLPDDCGRDAPDDARGRSAWHRGEGGARGIHLRGKDGYRAESRSGDRRIFAHQVRGVIRRLRSHQ